MQVLTQEDWNTVMYDGMRATSKWAALYFILLMTVGNYILFNLLVAILVEGFATQPVGCAPPNPLLPSPEGLFPEYLVGCVRRIPCLTLVLFRTRPSSETASVCTNI